METIVRRLVSPLLIAAAVCFGIGASAPARAQAPPYFTTNCVSSGCHSNPARIGSPIDNRTTANIIVVSDPALLDTDAHFAARLGGQGVGAMNILAVESPPTQRNAIRAYLIGLRDGHIQVNSRSFGSVNINGSTPAQTDALTNDRFLPATFHLDKTGSDTADFTVTGCGLNASGLNGSVPSDGSCTLSIAYSPQAGAAISRSATLTVIYSGNEGGDPLMQPINVTGSVPAAVFTFTPGATTTTARVDLAQSSDSDVGIIANSGQATLSITSIVQQAPLPSGATYQQIFPAGSCSNSPTLGAGQFCHLWLRFTPTVAGDTSSTFRIAPSPGAPRDVTLQGTGTRPQISPSNPPSLLLDFASSQLGVPKSVMQVITSSGNAPLSFTTLPTAVAARGGNNPGDFGVGMTCTSGPPVLPAGTCTLTVTFTPAALGPRTATLTISSNATNGPLVIDLSGVGSSLPEPFVTGPPSDFPDTVIGETGAQTRSFTIRNDRTRDITYSVADLTDFKIGTESCAARIVSGGGGTCTIAVRFQPTLGAGEGRRAATLPITYAGTLGDPAPSNASVGVAGVALLPLAQSAATVNAAAVVGSPTTSSVLLTNRASTAITLGALTFGGALPGDYALDASNGCTSGLVLGASTSCTLVIRFAPAAAGTRNASLAIAHSAPGSPQSLTLLGNATPAPQGRIELGAVTLTYADTQLGSSALQSLVVRNSGNLSLSFSAFTFGGTNAGDFARSGDCSAVVPLPIGGQCTLTVTFSPAALGARGGTLSIASDASNGTAVLALAGTGVPVPAPQVSLTPALLDFGTQTVGGIYPARRIHLANTGTADLAIAAIAVEGAGYASVSAVACPPVLSAGASCDVDIAFAPLAATSYAAAMRVSSNAVGSPHTTQLRGVGTTAAVPVLSWVPAVTALDFGTVSAGSLSPVQSVTLKNLGPGGVNLTVLNAIGNDASSFSVVGGTCVVGTSLFDGQTCQVDLRFAPGASGAKTASLQVASTGSFPPAVTLSGLGLAGPNPSLTLSATALAFETTRVGAQSLPATVRITSAGSGVVTVSAMTVTGAWTMQSTTCPALPFTLPAGTTCTVAVAFVPTGSGASVGSLKITSDAAPLQREVALSGSAEQPTEVSSGGCTVGTTAVGGGSAPDPLLWLMVLAAAAVLAGRALINRKRGRR